MARTAIAVTQLDRTGEAPGAQTTADATNKHFFTNNNRTLIEIISTDAGAQTVTFEILSTIDGVVSPGKSVSVPAGATRMVGPFPSAIYNQADGSVYVDPSVSTTLKFRAYSI